MLLCLIPVKQTNTSSNSVKERIKHRVLGTLALNMMEESDRTGDPNLLNKGIAAMTNIDPRALAKNPGLMYAWTNLHWQEYAINLLRERAPHKTMLNFKEHLSKMEKDPTSDDKRYKFKQLTKQLAKKFNPTQKQPKDESCFTCSQRAPKKCGICKKARYCSIECQRSNWKFHKLICKEWAKDQECSSKKICKKP